MPMVLPTGTVYFEKQVDPHYSHFLSLSSSFVLNRIPVRNEYLEEVKVATCLALFCLEGIFRGTKNIHKMEICQGQPTTNHENKKTIGLCVRVCGR